MLPETVRLAVSSQHSSKTETLQARSSVGERYLDTVEVGGSKPPVPTNFEGIKAKGRMKSV